MAKCLELNSVNKNKFMKFDAQTVAKTIYYMMFVSDMFVSTILTVLTPALNLANKFVSKSLKN